MKNIRTAASGKPINHPILDEKYQYLLNDTVFLIGNGLSRKEFDLERLRGRGTIIGCNALYRVFAPDILVAIDAKMHRELIQAKYCKENVCLVPGNRSTVLCKDSLIWKTERFNTSGCYSMQFIAVVMRPKNCYMLGMDGYAGNMFAGTNNYVNNDVRSYKGIVDNYKRALDVSEETMFINVNTKDAWSDACKQSDKYAFMTYDEFEEEVMK